MSTEERNLKNDNIALSTETTGAQLNLPLAETTTVNKPTLQIGSTNQAVTEL